MNIDWSEWDDEEQDELICENGFHRWFLYGNYRSLSVNTYVCYKCGKSVNSIRTPKDTDCIK